jgi:hypothetical protein
MAGTQLRLAGTTAQFAPVIKRAVGTLSDGRTVTLMIDTNQASSGATDVTGVAKIYLSLSSDASRTAFTTPVALTPAVAPASATRYAVASLAVASDNTTWVAWQGVDNALYVSKWTYSAGVFTFVSTATVVAAGAITNRFRTIDIDCAGTTPMIMAYEAFDATGSGSWHRVYGLKSDNVTWLRAVSITALPNGTFIKVGSEDASIAARGDGVVANVIRFVIYGTKTGTSTDPGDLVREYSWNYTSAAADAATIAGTWYTTANAKNASGTRRGLLFTINNTIWMWAGVYGTSSPRFHAAKLTTGVYTAPVLNFAGYVSTVALSNYFKIDTTSNIRTAWSATYKDNRLSFAFASIGAAASPRIVREIVFTFASQSNVTAKPTIDSVPRPLDAAQYLEGGPIGVYGGDNRRNTVNLKTYNYLVLYGAAGNAVASSGLTRRFRFVAEDTFEAPVVISPVSNAVVASNYPTYRVRVDNLNYTPNLYGKIEIQASQDPAFLVGNKSIIQDDSAFQYFGSKDGLSGSGKQVAIPTVTSAQALTSGTWYWRARIVSDKDTPGAWSVTASYAGVFSVSHPPTPLPISPMSGKVLGEGGADAVFQWRFTDPEPTDTQSAYRVIVTNDAGVGVPVDTGWVVSSANQHTITYTAPYYEIPQIWNVQLKDVDGIAGPVSASNDFIMGYKPVVDILTPADASTVTTAAPTITWSYSSAGARLQRAYRIVIVATSGPLTGTTIADTLWKTSAATSHAFTSNILAEGINYSITITVQDAAGLTGTDTVNVLTDWIPPTIAAPTVTVDTFKASIAWTDSVKDTDWISWRVYRRYMKPAAVELDTDNTANTWVLIYEATDDLTSYIYDDYLAPLNKTVQYAVVQLADRFGSLVESDIGVNYVTITMTSERYFFVPQIPVGSIASFEASSITGDQFTRDIESETLHVVGRGRQVQIGDDLGYSGSLTIKLRNPSTSRLNREFLERISYENNSVWIKSPFGDVILVALSNVQTNRLAGFGKGDIVDLAVGYTEIITPDEITRVE